MSSSSDNHNTSSTDNDDRSGNDQSANTDTSSTNTSSSAPDFLSMLRTNTSAAEEFSWHGPDNGVEGAWN
ncbi:hypothetical protein L486_07115 [Kwoniella mangroviensis CBS 10435]|uniref:Uncharacterized protein n=1 Tax=Kwoniella mangroviensis CBS 10435 TaxID=1331196 RepID=A0A1B9IJT9_9TREE|nr:hypothetical protein L486_07115 [Kwoniella mangroviensis CBS 10435]OCF73637.1 hypothetical protein I204_05480 [Kwoniella mangroviensis CBS 8886]